MIFLKQAVNSSLHPAKTIIDVLKKNTAGYEAARSLDTIHASDITKPNFCARKVALLDITKVAQKASYIPTALRTTFDVGNVISDLVREKWAGDSSYGHWKCVACSATRSFNTKPKNGCPQHGSKCHWKYQEVNFRSIDTDVEGSVDVFLELGSYKLFVTEVKIITPVEFEKIVAPLSEHRLRTSLYLNLIDRSASPYKSRINLQTGKVLYVSRAYGKLHSDYKEILPFKEFDVARDDAAIQPYLDAALKVKKFRASGVMPSGICATSFTKEAKGCSVCSQCFSGKFPAQE